MQENNFEKLKTSLKITELKWEEEMNKTYFDWINKLDTMIGDRVQGYLRERGRVVKMRKVMSEKGNA